MRDAPVPGSPRGESLTVEHIVSLRALPTEAPIKQHADRLAPLIERTFPYAWIPATAKRGEMRDAGGAEELEALVRVARALKDELLSGVLD